MRYLLTALALLACAALAPAQCSAPARGYGGYTQARTYSAPVYREPEYHDDVTVIFTLLPTFQPPVQTAGTSTVTATSAAAPAAAPVAPAAPPPAAAPVDDWAPIKAWSGASASAPTPASPASHARLTRDCASCHGGGRHDGGVTLFNAQGQFSPNKPLEEVYEAVAQGRMPKGRKLTLSDKHQTLSELVK